MVTLTLLHPQQNTALQQWRFEHESAIRIGRAPDNHVILNDSLVSRHHLELRCLNFNEQSWQLISQGTNGTFLNGVLVSSQILPDGSLIQLAKGGPLLKFQVRSVVSSPPTKSPPAIAVGCTHSGNPPNNLFCVHCGQPISVQRTIRQYQVLRTLGQGGMGTTYLAWEQTGVNSPAQSRLVVLKEMNADMAKIAKAQELFEREARVLKSLHHHGIPEYYDFFLDAGKKYLAMQLVHGQDLEKLVMKSGPVTLSQAVEWMIQTCHVLDYIHSQIPPLIHRDIKPANLMVRSSDNSVVVLDFGAVKEIGTAPGTRIGAEGYCAPEQERGLPLTQSDLYAIGPTLIFLLTGENPFNFYRPQGRSYRFQVNKIPSVTPQLKAVIERTTEPAPNARYPNAKELIVALQACL